MRKNIILLRNIGSLCLMVMFLVIINVFLLNSGIITKRIYALTPISTCAELQDMNLDLNEDYELSSSIDCSATSGWNGNTGFIPVGSNPGIPFTGSLDGNDYNITGLYINNPSNTSFVGLFGAANNASIIGVNLVNINFTGTMYMGGLVGYSTDTNIESCAVSGSGTTSIISSGSESGMYIGGLIGSEYGNAVINNSNVDINIEVGSYSGYIGGLVGVGFEGISIADSSSLIDVLTDEDSDYIGGLVGTDFGSLSIETSTAEIDIVAGDGNSHYGGLVGGEYGIGEFLNSIAKTTIDLGNESTNLGGLIGSSDGSVTLSNLNADIDINIGDSAEKIAGSIGGGYGDATIENVFSTGSISTGANATNIGGFIGDIKAINTINYSYTSVNITTGVDSSRVGGFGGTLDDNYLGGSVKNSHSSGFIKADEGGLQYAGGFVGYINSTILIEQSYSTGNISGGANSANSYVGGFVGMTTSGEINKSYTKGNVDLEDITSNDYIGGFVGLNNADIDSCYSSGNRINGYQFLGGFVGLHGGGEISNSFSRTNISTNYTVNPTNLDDYPMAGGFSGLTTSQISNSYSTGTVSGPTNLISNVNTNLTSDIDGSATVLTLDNVTGIVEGGYLYIYDFQAPFSTTLTSHINVGSLSVPVNSISGFTPGNHFILDQGVSGKEEELWINSIDGNIIRLYDYEGYYDTVYEHDSGSNVDLIPQDYSEIFYVQEVNGNDVTVERPGNTYPHEEGTIIQSYEIMPISKLGGFSGGPPDSESNISDSFWDINSSELSLSTGGMGLSTVAMKAQDSFNNWNFDTTWKIDPYVNNGYPSLNYAIWTDFSCSGSCDSGATCNQYGDPPEGKMWACMSNGSAYRCVYVNPNAGGNRCYLSCNSNWQSCGCDQSECVNDCISEHTGDPIGHYTYTTNCVGCLQKFTCGCDIPTSNANTISLDTSLKGALIDDPQVDIQSEGSTGIKDISIRFSNDHLLAEIEADFRENRDWRSVIAGEDVILGKSYIHNLTEQSGAAAEFTLYIPIPVGMFTKSVAICPGAKSLGEISESCANLQVLTVEDFGVTKIDNSYWKVSGLSGTGGYSIPFRVVDKMTRLKINTPSDHTLDFGTIQGLLSSSDSIEINFGSSWDFDSLGVEDIDLLDDGSNLIIDSEAGIDTWGVDINEIEGKVVFTAPTVGSTNGYILADSYIQIKIGQNAIYQEQGSGQIINPNQVGVFTIEMFIESNGVVQRDEYAIPIVDSDTVDISGFISAFIHFDIDTGTGETPGDIPAVDCSYTSPEACLIFQNGPSGTNYTVDFGELTAFAVSKSSITTSEHTQGGVGLINSIYFDLTTNSPSGCVVMVRSLNGGLKGPDDSMITSVTSGEDITINSGLYGFNMPVIAYQSSGIIIKNQSCDAATSDEYCGPSELSTMEVFSTNSLPVDNARVRMDIAVAAAYTNSPGTYMDTLSFFATALF